MYHILNNQKEDRAEGRGERAEREREDSTLWKEPDYGDLYFSVEPNSFLQRRSQQSQTGADRSRNMSPTF